jgi:hypothetical protein
MKCGGEEEGLGEVVQGMLLGGQGSKTDVRRSKGVCNKGMSV